MGKSCKTKRRIHIFVHARVRPVFYLSEVVSRDRAGWKRVLATSREWTREERKTRKPEGNSRKVRRGGNSGII